LSDITKQQHDAIHYAISTTCINEQECYDALWSYLIWQYEIDFVCNPGKRRCGKAKDKITRRRGIMPDRDWLNEAKAT
jgi:hypothetical protein